MTVSVGKNKTIVPNLSNIDLDKVEDILSKSNLSLGKVERKYDDKVDENKIISQSVNLGKKLKRELRLILLSAEEKKIKKLNKRIKRLEKQVKGNQEMSRLLEELKGQTATVTVDGFGAEYEILDIDEDWVKLSRETNKQQKETKLVRIEDIQDIQL